MKQNINLTIDILVDTPNLNSIMYPRDVVQSAFQEAQIKQLPIVDYTSDKGKVIGIATPVSCCLIENHYLIYNDCFLFDDDTIKKLDMEFKINEYHKNEDNTTIIDNFRIVSMSIDKDDEI